MMMPGFTAEVSLQRASGSYRSSGAPLPTASGTEVVPQMIYFCEWYDADTLICGEYPYVNGGGGGPSGPGTIDPCRKCMFRCKGQHTQQWCEIHSGSKGGCAEICS